MIKFWYCANFCADCGIDLTPNKKQKLIYKYFCRGCYRRHLWSIWYKKLLYLSVVILAVSWFHQPPPAMLPLKTALSIPRGQETPAPLRRTVLPLLPKEGSWFCGAVTKNGKKCRRRVKTPGYCWQHQSLAK